MASKYAFITGATQGMGKAIAFSLAGRGYDLFLTARTQSDLETVKADIEKMHKVKVEIFSADLAEKESRNILIAEVKKRVKSISVLVNNAGVFFNDTIATIMEADLRRVMEINLFAPIHLSQAFIPLLKLGLNAHVINICSISSKEIVPETASYTISKFGLFGFSGVLREELKSQNIKVTSILPGATYTRSWEGKGVEEEKLIQSKDVALVVQNLIDLSFSANIDEIKITPMQPF
ncbi:MAG: short-subunit dehydrogenase [Sphingobacteriales bacterium]|jgi:short-subunit dehydrogenase